MIQSPCRRAIASVSTISSRVATKPVGLAGELKKMSLVAGVTAFFDQLEQRVVVMRVRQRGVEGCSCQRWFFVVGVTAAMN